MPTQCGDHRPCCVWCGDEANGDPFFGHQGRESDPSDETVAVAWLSWLKLKPPRKQVSLAGPIPLSIFEETEKMGIVTPGVLLVFQ